MDLTSCDNCGLVYDRNHVPFPKEIWNDDGSVKELLCDWTGDGFTPKFHCPVCGGTIYAKEDQV